MVDNIPTSHHQPQSAFKKAFSVKANWQSIFQRRPSNYAPIDGIRGLSIILVLFYHIFLVYDKSSATHTVASMLDQLGLGWAWAFNGDKGVDVFFVMSGFLISGILLRQYQKLGHLNLKNFYIRRYLRLTPAYYFMLIIYWLLAAPNSENIWANFLYVSNFIDYQHQAAGWTWSLAVEEQFYFIYPLILLAVLRWTKSPGWILLGLFVLSFVVNAFIVLSDAQLSTTPFSQIYTNHDYFNHYFTVLYDNLYTRFGGLVVGCLAAYMMHFYQDKLKSVMNSPIGIVMTWLSIAIIICLMAFPIFLPRYDNFSWLHLTYDIANHTLFAVGVGVLILAMILQQHAVARACSWFFSLNVWYPIATLSYSLYLIHLVVMVIVIPAMMQQTGFSMGEVLLYGGLLSSLISFLIATFMYVFIEKPVMNLRK